MSRNDKAMIVELSQALQHVMNCHDCGGRGWTVVPIGEDDFGEDPCECRIEADELLDRLGKEGVVDRILLVKQANEEWLLSITGVIGVGICAEGISVMVTADCKQQGMPSMLDGFPVIIKEIGEIVPF